MTETTFEDFKQHCKDEHRDKTKKELEEDVSEHLHKVREMITDLHVRTWGDVPENDLNRMVCESMVDLTANGFIDAEKEQYKALFSSILRDMEKLDESERELLRNGKPEELRDVFGVNVENDE